MIRINEIIEQIRSYHPNADIQSVMKAYVYSAKVHAGQTRKSGEPYLSHPLAVTGLLAEMHLDVASICAGLLHDVVEDTQATLEDVTDLLGPEIAALVDGVTKITETLDQSTRKGRQAQSLRKMILAMASDIRVLLIKLADRLHNMRTLGFMSESSQKRIAAETRDIYAPMAHRLGIRRWQAELEDLSLFYLEPETYREIKEGVATRRSERQSLIEEVKAQLEQAMKNHGISCRIYGRPKHFWSIYQKMLKQNVDINGLFDLTAFRVIVPELKDCYEALGVVHNVWRPIPGRFRDYIGMPKPNGYQSLHTTVLAPGGQRMEVQIRTEEMHQVAEEGIAAHWRYKDQGGDDSDQQRDAWLRRLLESVRENTDPSEFMQSLRMDLYPEEIFVFTPAGEVKEMPRGSTPVDFAYAIHTEVGHRCVGAKINSRMVPLRTQLQTGDQVEIVTQKNHNPSKDWLKFVATGRARSKIRSFIRESERSRAVSLGKDILDKELRKKGHTYNAVLKDGSLNRVMSEFSYKDTDHLVAAVAYGKLSPRQVVNRMFKEEEPEKKPGLIERSLSRLRRRPQDGVKVLGIDDMLVRFAKCCNPLPGDPIKGFITRGKGVTVHTAHCRHLDEVDPARLLEVEWAVEDDQVMPARIQVISNGRPGTLADMAGVLKAQNVNILEADIKTNEKNQGLSRFTLQVHDTTQLNQVLKSIQRVPGVQKVKRT